jgi:hypothetical protein
MVSRIEKKERKEGKRQDPASVCLLSSRGCIAPARKWFPLFCKSHSLIFCLEVY